MTSDDHRQVSTLLLRLRNAAATLATAGNPMALASAIESLWHELMSVTRQVPGDPAAIEAQAAACRRMAMDLDGADASLDTVAKSVPSVWRGPSATEAVTALKATQTLMEQAAPAMRTTAGLLEVYADEVRRLDGELAHHRQDLADVVRDLDSMLDIGRALVATVAQWWDADGFDDLLRRALAAVRGAIQVFEQLQAAEDTLRRGLRDVTGKARAGAIGSPHVSPFDTVLLAGAGISGPANQDNGILSTAQLRRAGDRLDTLPPAERQRFDQLLLQARSPAERAYLMKALAAGHGVDKIARFADQIRGKPDDWLRKQLSLVDPAARGGVTYDGRLVKQFDGTTCGSTSILVARAMNDPLYALSLTTDSAGQELKADGFAARLEAEEQRIHDATNTLWPQALGTSPWGLSGELNQHADSFGTQYDWRLVDDTSAGSVNPALDDAVGAVDAGYTVPVLIGDSYPAHYVLLVGHEGDKLVFYNPSGKMAIVSEDDFRNGNMSALGFPHVQGVVTPR